MIIGKGDKQAVVRFSDRSMLAIRSYMEARAALDGSSGKPLASLPLFARHDKGAGKKIKSMGTGTGRNIVHQRAREALGAVAWSAHHPPFTTALLRHHGPARQREPQDGTGTCAARQHPGNAALCTPF